MCNFITKFCISNTDFFSPLIFSFNVKLYFSQQSGVFTGSRGWRDDALACLPACLVLMTGTVVTAVLFAHNPRIRSFPHCFYVQFLIIFQRNSPTKKPPSWHPITLVILSRRCSVWDENLSNNEDLSKPGISSLFSQYFLTIKINQLKRYKWQGRYQSVSQEIDKKWKSVLISIVTSSF